MRIAAGIVLILMIAAALWLLRPEWVESLVERVTPGAEQSAPPDATDPSRSQRTDSSSGTPSPTPNAAPTSGANHSKTTGQLSIAPAITVREQAEQYVATLAETEPQPVSVEKADHFVSGEQVVKLLPNVAIEQTTIADLQLDSKLSATSPITVVREVEQVERMSPERLIAESGGNLDAPVRQVLADDSVKETTVRRMLEVARANPDAPILVLKRVEHFEQTTPGELLQSGADRQQPIKVVRGAHGIELARLKDLVRSMIAVSDDSLFYVRTVRDGDAQGIWGIVHDGLIENFARGMAIRRGESVNTYQVAIPTDADEREVDASSSFLGRLIHRKVSESFVYNVREHRMGRNPDQIFPGQEIVIVNFEPEELITIYEHFVARRS